MSHRRTTILPTSSSSSSTSSSTHTLQRNRQYTHLASQLAQLNANLADTENLLRVTSCQADVVRGLGSWMGGLFMAASKVLGEEGVAASSQGGNGNVVQAGQGVNGANGAQEGGGEE